MERSYGYLSNFSLNKHVSIMYIRDLHNKVVFLKKKVWKKSITALHCLTQDVQHSTCYPKTHVGGPDLDFEINWPLELWLFRQRCELWQIHVGVKWQNVVIRINNSLRLLILDIFRSRKLLFRSISTYC